MAKKRVWVILFFVIILFLIVILRMYSLMILKNDFYTKKLKNKTKIVIDGSTPLRGRILDRNGVVLVDNKGVKSVVYTKIRGIKTSDEIDIAYKLADLLPDYKNIDENIIKKFYYLNNKDYVDSKITSKERQKYQERKITSDDLYNLKIKRITEKDLTNFNDRDKNAAYIYYLMNKGYSYEEKIIATDVSEDVYALISEGKITGVRGEITWVRTYPQGDTLRALFGSVSKNGVPKELKNYYLKKGYKLTDRVGVSYLEKEYEDYLRGTKAKYLVNSDNTLTKIKEEIPGNDLYLSIDINLQKRIDDILKTEIINGKKKRNTEYYNHSYAIIGNPNTGEIYALSGEQVLDNKNIVNMTTGTFTSSYTVGSVVKGATIAVGYNNGLINEKTYVTDGCVKLYSNPKKCSFKRLGRINDKRALAMSSNYFQYLIAISLTGNKYKYNMKLNPTVENFNTYRDTLSSYGLGVKTGLDVPNEVVGIKGSQISGDLLLNLAIGQYDTYTPVELLQYINTIATTKRTKLSLMKEIKDRNGKVILNNSSQVLNEISIDPKYLERIREGLKQVFKIGTGRGYINLNYKPAGKTGTAQSFIDVDNDKKIDVETISSSLVAYAPYDNPSVSMVIMSPNVSHKNGKTDYMAYINKTISKDVTKILEEEGYLSK